MAVHFTRIDRSGSGKSMRLSGEKTKTCKTFFLLLLLAILSFAAYANTLKGNFVWDDRALFVEHYDVWQWKNIKHLVTCQDNLFEDRYTGYYRPLPNLTFLLDRYLWGQNPAGYHLTNIIFHVLTTLCVYWVAAIIFRDSSVAFLSALCFAWHPVHTEAVAWINGRNNVVSSFFYILAFAFYLEYATKKSLATRSNHFPCYALSLFAFSLSLLSKEYAFTFPFAIACYQYFGDQTKQKKKISTTAYRLAPYFIVIFGYLVVRSMVLPFHGVKFMHWESMWMRILTVPKTLSIYFRLLVLPLDLTVHYETTLVSSMADPVFWLTLTIVLCFCLLLYYSHHSSPASSFMFVWIVLTLTPVLNLVPLSDEGTFVAERYLYLPSAGFCIILGNLLVISWNKWHGRWKKALRPISLLACCLLLQWYGFGTINRNLSWLSELSLWKDAVAQKPGSYRPYFNLAVAHRDAGNYDSSLRMFEKAYWMAPAAEDRGIILGNIGYVYYALREYSLAEANLKEAIAISPRNPANYNLLGNTYFMEHNFREALIQYRRAIKINPTGKDPLINIGIAYYKLGDMDRAIDHLEKVKSITSPDRRLYYYLGAAYDRKGMRCKAKRYYRTYLKLLPRDANYQKVVRRLKKMEAARQSRNRFHRWSSA